MHNRGVMSLIAIVFLLGQTAGPTGVATATGESGIPQPEIDAENVVIEIDLRTDGSAQWTVEHRVRLDDPNVTQGFEMTRDELEQNRSAFLAPFEQYIRSMATTAQEETGREMVVENVSVEASREQIPQEYGVVSYQFRWYGFAETDDSLRMGDALSGLFLDESTVLLVTWPENTTLADATPMPDDRRDQSVVWNGPIEFGEERPTVALESETESFGPTLRWDAGSNDELVAIASSGFLLTTLGAGVAGIVRYRRGSKPEEESADDESAGDDQPQSQAEPPEDLLSNEERVLELVDNRGGRVKQQEVVDEFGWSETKTSEVVGELREAGEIEVYRLGRENVLALPDVGIGIGETDKSSGDNE